MKKLLTLQNILLAGLILALGLVFAMPLLIVPAAFFILPAAVILGKRVSFLLPLGVFSVFFLLSFFLNYNILVVFSFPILAVCYVSVTFSLRMKHYIHSVITNALVFLAAILASLAVFGAVFVPGEADPRKSISYYIQNAHSDFIVVALSKQALRDAASAPINGEPQDWITGIDFSKITTSKTEPNAETRAALDYYAYTAEIDLGRYGAEPFLSYALLLAFVAFLFSYFSLPLTIDASLTSEDRQKYVFFPETILRYFQVSKTDYRQPFSLLAVPKEFFAIVYVPITVLMWLTANFEIGGMFSILWNTACLIPFAFSGLAMCCYLIDYIDNFPIRTIVKSAALIIFALSLLEPFILFIFSVIGVADAIIHTRRLLERLLLE